MNDSTVTIQQLKDRVSVFIHERDWDKFHPAKNLSTNLVVEAVELLEKFTWLTPEESEKKVETDRVGVEHELVDVFFTILAFCARYNIDLASAFEEKMKLNAQKYPVEKSHGKNAKYTNL
jgi:dCTP diphosphatase